MPVQRMGGSDVCNLISITKKVVEKNREKGLTLRRGESKKMEGLKALGVFKNEEDEARGVVSVTEREEGAIDLNLGTSMS